MASRNKFPHYFNLDEALAKRLEIRLTLYVIQLTLSFEGVTL